MKNLRRRGAYIPAFLSLAALGGASAGCEESAPGGSVLLGLYESVEDEARPSGLDGNSVVDEVELTFIDPNNVCSPIIQISDLDSRSADLKKLSHSVPYRLHVRGFQKGDDSFRVHFYGASELFDVQPGEGLSLQVQVGPAECITFNSPKPQSHALGGRHYDQVAHRAGGTATQLGDGRIVFIGGGQQSGGDLVEISNSIEVYDPQQQAFIVFSETLPQARAHHSATLLADGRSILVLGGYNEEVLMAGAQAATIAASGYIIDIDAARPVQETGDVLPFGYRAHHAVALLRDGSVLIAGGEGPDGALLDSVYRYEVKNELNAGRFLPQAPLHIARSHATLSASQHRSALALVVGGLGVPQAGEPVQPLQSIEVFTTGPVEPGACKGDIAVTSPEYGCFFPTGGLKLREARWGHRSVHLPGQDRTVIIGGYAELDRTGAKVAQIEALQHSADQLAMLTTQDWGWQLPEGLGEPAVVRLYDDSLLVAGGWGPAGPTAAVWRLKPLPLNAEGFWPGYGAQALQAGCQMTEARYDHFAFARKNHGTVLISGGLRLDGGTQINSSRRAELYFPSVANLAELYQAQCAR